MQCPKCGCPNVFVQREQVGNIGASQNTVIIQKQKKSRGCLFWLLLGWWLIPMKFMLFDWWYYPFFGGKNKKGWNLNGSKTFNQTVAVCQNCGHSWKV